jgi:hypothetical protein
MFHVQLMRSVSLKSYISCAFPKQRSETFRHAILIIRHQAHPPVALSFLSVCLSLMNETGSLLTTKWSSTWCCGSLSACISGLQCSDIVPLLLWHIIASWRSSGYQIRYAHSPVPNSIYLSLYIFHTSWLFGDQLANRLYMDLGRRSPPHSDESCVFVCMLVGHVMPLPVWDHVCVCVCVNVW